MYSFERLPDIDALEMFLFGGLPAPRHDGDVYRPPSIPGRQEGIVTGYAVYNLETGEITCYNGPPPQKAPK